MSIPFKFFCTILLAVVACAAAVGSPAFKRKLLKVQRDGTQLVVVQHGSEAAHYYLTGDGVPVVEGEDGSLYYMAVAPGCTLVPTAMLAHEAALRSVHEQAVADEAKASLQRLAAQNALPHRFGIGSVSQASVPSMGEHTFPVVLIEFQDVKFTAPCDSAFFVEHLNADVLASEGGHPSVRRYFLDQSYGQFNPHFDIVGRVTVVKDMSFYGSDKTSQDRYVDAMIHEALTQLVSRGVDFTPYMNENGAVPFVGVIYAGEPQCVSGVSTDIWPAYVPSFNYATGGVNFRSVLYTSAMADYTETGAQPDGIGTFCHEFSHALGLPDMYGNGVFGLDYWDIMDAGQFWHNDGRQPVGYSAYERQFMGWLQVEDLEPVPQVVKLSPLGDGDGPNKAFRLVNPHDTSGNEYFLLENRQADTWFSPFFGYGMLVYHVMYSYSKWVNNNLNNVSTRPDITIIPADNVLTPSDEVTDVSQYRGDPFPGCTDNRFLSPVTIPNTKVYSGGTMPVRLSDIHVDDAGRVVFALMADGLLAAPDVLARVDEGAQTLSLTWGAVRRAETYHLTLSHNGEPCQDITTADTCCTFPLSGEGDYVVTAEAKAGNYLAEDTTTLTLHLSPTGIPNAVASPERLAIYSLDGRLLAHGSASGLSALHLPQGFYLVKRPGLPAVKVFVR